MSLIQRHYSIRRSTPLAIAVACTLVILAFLPTVVTVLFLAAFMTGIFIITYRLQNYLLAILSGAFLFRLVFIIGDSIVGVLPSVPISSGHNQRAIEVATAWLNGQLFVSLGNVTPMRVLMAHLLAPFYVVIGQSPIAGRIAIALLSLCVGYLVFQIAHHVTDRRTSILAAAATLFWPTIVYRSVVIQREIIITIVLLTVLWVAVQWLDSITLPTVGVVLLAAIVMFILRKENLLLIAAMVGCVTLIKSRDKPYYIAGLALVGASFFTYFSLNFERFTGYGTTLSPAALDSFAYGRAHGDAVYLVGLHYETWLDVILYAPIKVVYFLYTPLPWHIQGPTELFVGMSALALVVATVYARRGFAILQEKPYYLGLLCSYLLTGIVTYSIIEMNYGAAVRRRIQFIPILLLLAAVGLSKVELEVRWRR